MQGSSESVPSAAAIDQEALFAQHIKRKQDKHHLPSSNGVVSLLTYISSERPEDENVNTNCRYYDDKGNMIVCRHLAAAFLLYKNRDYLYREQFRTQAGMLENTSLRENFYDRNQVAWIGSYHLLPKIDGNALGLGLAQACEGMKAGEEKKFLFQSENHEMAIIVRLKEDKDTGLLHYSVKFFDPNKTLVHRRFDIHKDLSQIQLNQCLSETDIDRYFVKIKAGILICLSSERGRRPDPKVTVLPDYNAVELASTLTYRLEHNISPEEITTIINDIASSEDESLDKKELLAAKNARGTPGLFLALQKGNISVISAYATAILSSRLSDAEKTELLAAKAADGAPGLSVALKENYFAAMKAYAKAILSSSLPDAKKTELLAAKGADGIPALSRALQNAHNREVSAHVETILSSSLPDAEKKELLAAKRGGGGFPGLHVAFANGHYSEITTYAEAILSSSLAYEDKKELLAAKSAYGCPGFFAALEEGYATATQAYAEVILSSSLADEDKVELLAAKIPNGTLGIDVAIQKGYALAISYYVEAITSSHLEMSKLRELLPVNFSILKLFAEWPIEWFTVALVGLTYEAIVSYEAIVYDAHHDAEHDRLANEMIVHAREKMQNPDKASEETPEAYLRSISARLESRKTKLALCIDQVLPKPQNVLTFHDVAATSASASLATGQSPALVSG